MQRFHCLVPPGSGYRQVFVMLSLGFILRLALLFTTTDMPLMIVDEQHYHQLATNLSAGHGFAWGPEKLTSKRPPLYPFLISLMWRLFGIESLQLVRLLQIFLSLTNVLLLYFFSLHFFDHRTSLLASTLFCFYPSFIAFNYFLLTEVLFTLLLTIVAYGYMVLLRTPTISIAFGTGAALGFAALTRSVMWPFSLILCPLAFFSLQESFSRRLALATGLFLGFVTVTSPWVVRNTRLQQAFTVIDTMGGLNALMGNYDYTPLNRAWDAVSLTGEQAWSHELYQQYPEAIAWTEGQKDKWAMRQAIRYIFTHPALTMKRAAIKLANFWGLERVVIAGWQQGLYRHTPTWFALLGAIVITISYIGALLLAVLGICFVPPQEYRIHFFLILIIAFICCIHIIVFGHERYHLPLIPFLLLYSAAALVQQSWLQLRRGGYAPVISLGIWMLLFLTWGREIFFIEQGRIKEFLYIFWRS